MLAAGDRVLVAVSGGPDSTAMLAALAALSPRAGVALHAAHLNHQLRGDESGRDQACAETVAAHLGVPCTVASAIALAGGPNLEARARAQRYAFLAQVAAAKGCTKVATGHTLDDQAETVLMRLLRGTGADGLMGIHAVREGHIIRPLIECTRQQVLAFLRNAGLPFCDDSSNQDRRFLRNRVRHEVLPLLQAINPDVRRHLATTAEIMTAEVRALDDLVEQMLAPLRLPDGALIIGALAGVPPALRARLLRAWLRTQRKDLRGLGAAHVTAVLAIAQGARPNARVRLPGGQLAVREYDRLYLRAEDGNAQPEAPQLLQPGATVCLATGWRISAAMTPPHDAGSWQTPADLWSVIADADAVAGPVVVRTAQVGDRVRPLGLGGARKLQDIFVDRKLPLRSRRTCPVVECDGEILWVPGVVRGDRA